MSRTESVRKERLYAIGCLLAAVLLFGTSGSIELNAISFEVGVWQIICSVVLGIFCTYGIYLEETRTAKRGRNCR